MHIVKLNMVTSRSDSSTVLFDRTFSISFLSNLLIYSYLLDLSMIILHNHLPLEAKIFIYSRSLAGSNALQK